MKHLLTVLALALLAKGLWTHDWRLIVAAFAVAAIWPLVRSEVSADAERERLLDELWGGE